MSSGSNLTLENPSIEVVTKVPGFATLNSGSAILITSTSAYRKFFDTSVTALPMILVSHHPHDGDLASILKVRRDFLLVNLGEYQYLSNNLRSVPSVILPVLIPPPSFRPVEPVLGGVVGHVSSLVPSKGFHHLARAWASISRANPDSRLEVIGGSSLYGFLEEHPRLPTSVKYGNRIEKLLTSGGNSKSVEFLGVISGSIESHIDTWSLAALNPAGIAEADPSSVKDCMRKGVPVVGAFDYGLRSYLRQFPELQIKSPRNTARLVNR
jgi:glycosyltransferase involved in cell wall biosynthesis